MSRTPLSRPTLLPGLPRIWRTAHTLQLGIDPAHAVLLDLPDPRAARLLDLLDGSRPERLALAEAGAIGLRPGDATALLDTLHAAGLVVPAPRLYPPAMPARLASEAAALAYAGPAPPARTLRRRAAARVVITGAGRLAAGLATALAGAGTGHVQADLPGVVTGHDLPGTPLTPADLGKPLAETLAAALRQAFPEVRTRPVRRGAASLVIQLGAEHPPPESSQRNRPHLSAAIREGTVLVGPLIVPATSPCANCLVLHRADRDANWPPPPLLPPPARPPQEPCTMATLMAATAYLTAEVLTFLNDETPETLGAEVVITRPGHSRRRTWPPHPQCRCTRRIPPAGTPRAEV